MRTEKKSPVEDEEIIIIGTRPEISITFTPIGRHIKITQKHRFSEIKLDHNWKSCGQHNLSYYRPQPATYNQR